MTEWSKQQLDNRQGIFSLWLTWVGSTMALLAIVLSPLIVRPIIVPIVAVVLEMLFYMMVRRNRSSEFPQCYLIPFLTSRSLIWSTVAILVVLLLTPVPKDAETIPELPFIPIVIIAPITFVMCMWQRLRGVKYPFCVDCRLRHGTPVEKGFLGVLFCQEGTYQVKFLSVISGLMWGITWTYYGWHYIDVNIISADVYFFFILPTVVVVMSIIYMAIRYFSIWNYYEQDLQGSEIRTGDYTELRFILVWSNYIFVRFADPANDVLYDPAQSKGDTPATLKIGRQREVGVHVAKEYLERMMPVLKNADVKFMYTTETCGGASNTMHYMVMIDDADHTRLEDAYPTGTWLSMLMLSRLIDDRQLAPAFSAELYRIYTMVMAWKSYDRNGERLYSVRNYKPTFRLEDLKKYDIDYSDRRWLLVANDNADKPLFGLRRWWRRSIQGKDY